MKSFIYLCGLLFFTGCFQSHSDDHLSSVPVTNNPNLLPPSAHGLEGVRF